MDKLEHDSKKSVIVTDDMYDDQDEFYWHIFKCPNCNDNIARHHKYCPECGLKLEWKLKEEYW